MNRRLGTALLGFAFLGFPGVRAASADSLLLTDGRLVIGRVTRVDSGYLIRTASGEMKFGDDQVQHWTHSEAVDPTGNTPSPAAGAPAAGPAPAAPPPAGSPAGAAPARGHEKTTVQKTVAVLMERGNDALAAGDYRAARDAYADLLSLDPRNALAAQGAGYAYLQVNNYVKARDVLEVAYAGSQPPPRSVACNLAVALGKTRNPMRAAKVLKEYLAAHPQPLDEPALNALAATLFQADETTRHNAFFAQVAQFYEDYNKKLEATRPGERRWGSQWLPAGQADRKLTAYTQKRAQIEALLRRSAVARANFNTAARNAEDAIAASRLHQASAARVPLYRQQMAAAQTEYQAAQQELVVAQQGFEMPPVEESLAMVAPEFAGSAPPAVASATPPGSTGTPAGQPASLFGPDPAPATPGPAPAPVAPPRPVSAGPAGTPATPAGTPPRPVTPPPAVIVAAPPAPPAPTRRLHVQTEAVGFPVAPDLLVTTSEAADHATSISVLLPDGIPCDAELVTQDPASGLALLRLKGKKISPVPLADAFAGGAVTCVAFPDVSLFDPVAVNITGTAGAPKAGAADGKWTVNLARSPRIGGGPLLVNNRVVGVQLANHDSDRAVVPMATLDDLKRLLSGQALPPGIAGAATDPRSVTVQLTATRERG